MKNDRLGCVTPSGIFAGLLAIILVVVVGLARGGVLFSPGPLNAQAGAALGGATSHADLAGECSACHAAFWESANMADRCVACHTYIAAQLQDGSSLHGILNQDNPSLTCRSCHPDHRGPDAPLTLLDNTNFPHDRLGYPLVGQHTQVACAACHINNVYRGIPTDCYSCHAAKDIHNGQYGADCSTCHTPEGWKSTTFDHSRFKLDGQHAQAACAGCHINNVFQGLPTDCYSCHAAKDVHNGQFGADCAICHTTAGWLPVAFDHNQSAFKLDGQHAQVACTDCHINNVFQGTPTDCYACHAANDKHNGQFGTACATCHTTAGWLPASFDHSSFPLTGAHAGLPCTQCHTGGVYTGLSSACSACHADPAYHAGLFGTNCSQCHNTSNWNATYTGSHPAISINHEGATCRDCHTVNLSTATCTKCHDSNNPGGDD